MDYIFLDKGVHRLHTQQTTCIEKLQQSTDKITWSHHDTLDQNHLYDRCNDSRQRVTLAI